MASACLCTSSIWDCGFLVIPATDSFIFRSPRASNSVRERAIIWSFFAPIDQPALCLFAELFLPTQPASRRTAGQDS
jgi:hypothetical protein